MIPPETKVLSIAPLARNSLTRPHISKEAETAPKILKIVFILPDNLSDNSSAFDPMIKDTIYAPKVTEKIL